MTKIKYDADLMKFISLFESLTNAGVKDCITDEQQLIFIVDEHDIGKAIGRDGVHVKRMSEILKKPIKVVEFSPDIVQFVKNFIYPLQAREITQQDGIISIAGPDTKTKGMLIGRDAKNLLKLKEITGRYFKFADIKVV